MREPSKQIEACSSTEFKAFICGVGGNKDRNGLPERIYVCPAEGSEVILAYTRVNLK